MFGATSTPAAAAMFQTIAKMLGVPPDMLASAMQTIVTAGDRLENMEAAIGRIERALGTGGYSIEPARTALNGSGNEGSREPLREVID